MSDFYTKVNFLDRKHLFADYYKMITCLSLRMSEINYIKQRLKRFSGFGIENQIYNISKCCDELNNLKEDIRTEYYSLVEIIDTVNKYEKDAANMIGAAVAKEQAQKLAYELISKFIEAIIGPSRIIPGLLPFVNPITPNPLLDLGILISGGSGSVPSGINIKALSDDPNFEKAEKGLGGTYYVGKVSKDFKTDNLSGEVNCTVGKTKGILKGDFSLFNWDRKVSKKADGTVDDDDSMSLINAELAAGLSYNFLSGNAKIKGGNDTFGSELSVEGSAGNAELSGKAEFSIGEDGINLNASGKAMVSAVEGEVKGTISVFGIDITGSLEGYAGAAGYKGKIGIEDGKFVIKGGVAALIGGGAGIEVGLNDGGIANVKSAVDKGIEFGKDVVDAGVKFGKDVIDTGKDIVNTGKDMLDTGVGFVSDFFSGWF